MVPFWALLALSAALWWLFDAAAARTRPERRFHDYRCLLSGANSCFALRLGAHDFAGASHAEQLVHWNALDQTEKRSSGIRNGVAIVSEVVGSDSILIVALGQCRPHHFISDEILGAPGHIVCTLTDHRDLLTSIDQTPVLVLVHDSLLREEIEDACRVVRGRWPVARILVIRDDEESLEDWLFDDRVASDVSGRDLIARILFLVQTVDFRRLRDGQR